MPEPTCQVDSPLSAMEMALSSRAAQLPAVSVASQMEWVFMNNTGKAFACNIYTSWPIRGEKYVCVLFFFFEKRIQTLKLKSDSIFCWAHIFGEHHCLFCISLFWKYLHTAFGSTVLCCLCADSGLGEKSRENQDKTDFVPIWPGHRIKVFLTSPWSTWSFQPGIRTTSVAC